MPYQTIPEIALSPIGPEPWALAALAAAAAVALAVGVVRGRRRASTEAEPVEFESVEDATAVEVAFRVETVPLDPGGSGHVLWIADARGCLAIALRVPDGGAPPGVAIRGLDPSAIRCDARALLDTLSYVPLTLGHMRTLGLFQEDPGHLVDEVANLAAAFRGISGSLPVRTGDRRNAEPAPRPPVSATGHVDARPQSGRLADAVYSLGAVDRSPDPDDVRRPLLIVSDVRFGASPAGRSERAALAALLAPWHRAARDAAWPTAMRAFGPAAWTPDVLAFVDARHPCHERRLQAARLQPAFVPTLASTPTLLAAVDAGRAFEAALARLVDAVDPGEGSLSAARMRRLRTYPATPPAVGDGNVSTVLSCARSYPLDRLPLTAAGWSRLTGALAGPVMELTGMGLAPSALTEGLRPDDVASSNAWLPPGWADGLHGARDMAARLVTTVLRPALEIRRGGPGPRRDADALAFRAARMLFGERSVPAILALQADWHRRLPALEAALPAGLGEVYLEWPALFGTFEPVPGIEARCLTTTHELKAEGARGLDCDGVAGLSHCVGGYSRKCAMGHSHVVALRSIGDGPVKRLATLEIWFDGASFGIMQLRGPMNADPGTGLRSVAETVLGRILDRTLPTDPEAAKLRTAPLGVAVDYDAAAAFQAWERFLTRKARDAGLEGAIRDLA